MTWYLKFKKITANEKDKVSHRVVHIFSDYTSACICSMCLHLCCAPFIAKSRNTDDLFLALTHGLTMAVQMFYEIALFL